MLTVEYSDGLLKIIRKIKDLSLKEKIKSLGVKL